MPVRTALVAIAILIAAATKSSAAVNMPVVERIQVIVESSTPISPILIERIETSVARVAERLAVGKPIDLVQEQRAEYERIIGEIFTRLLTGFTLDQPTLVVAPESRLSIRLSPDGPVVSLLDLTVTAPELPDKARVLLEEQEGLCQDRLARIFVGVPVMALDWARKGLLVAAEEETAEIFPGFVQEISVTANVQLALNLRLTPAQPRVDEVEVEMQSSTLPQFLIGAWQGRASEYFQSLNGLPVAFLRRHQKMLEKRGVECLAGDQVLDGLGLVWQANLFPGSATKVKLTVNARHYSFKARASLEIDDPPLFALALSGGLSPLAEWQVLGDLVIDADGQVDVLASLVYLKSSTLSMGVTYNLTGEEHFVWMSYSSGRGDLFRLEGDLETDELRATIGLIMESQFSVTLTVDSDRNYSVGLQVEL